MGLPKLHRIKRTFRLPASRQILYCGKVEVKALQRIGIDFKVEEEKRAKMRSFGALEYVTDHYDLMADLVVE